MENPGCSIIKAHRSICTKISVFKGMAPSRGKFLRQAIKGVVAREVFGVKLHGGTASDVSIDQETPF